MRATSTFVPLAAALLGALAVGTVAGGAPPPVALPVALPGPPRFEYAVRCVFRGDQSEIMANYKLRCTELGSEITVCDPLGYEVCRLKLVNQMGQQGWRYVGVDDDVDQGLGPRGSVTFERQVPMPTYP